MERKQKSREVSKLRSWHLSQQQLLLQGGLELKFLQKTDLGCVQGGREKLVPVKIRDQIETAEQMQDPLKAIKNINQSILKGDGDEAYMPWL